MTVAVVSSSLESLESYIIQNIRKLILLVVASCPLTKFNSWGFTLMLNELFARMSQKARYMCFFKLDISGTKFHPLLLVYHFFWISISGCWHFLFHKVSNIMHLPAAFETFLKCSLRVDNTITSWPIIKKENKIKKTRSFRMSSGGMERDEWHEMG